MKTFYEILRDQLREGMNYNAEYPNRNKDEKIERKIQRIAALLISELEEVEEAEEENFADDVDDYDEPCTCSECTGDCGLDEEDKKCMVTDDDKNDEE